MRTRSASSPDPAGDSRVATPGPDEGTLRLFVVNRSLQDDVVARVAFDSYVGDVGSISMAIVNGTAYTSENTLFDPNAVSTKTLPVPPAPEFDITFPAHSLIVFAVRAAK